MTTQAESFIITLTEKIEELYKIFCLIKQSSNEEGQHLSDWTSESKDMPASQLQEKLRILFLTFELVRQNS